MNESTNISVSFKNNVSGMSKLERYEQRLTSLKNIIKTMPNSVKIDDAKGIKENTKKLDKFTKTLNKGFDVANFTVFVKLFKEFIATLSNYTSKVADYVENINLMNVAFHRTEDSMEDASLAGSKLVNTLSEMYGLDESNLTRTVGIFKQLANAMNISDETGTKLAETLTKLTIDTASLYNLSFERASSVLQSALAGQTKPVRSAFGADITETTLQVTLDSYGIDTTVRELSYAEKRLIIVTSLLNQLTESQNDAGKTIESVANQMRVFNEQTQRLGRAIGSVFMPVLQAVLPYLNAILMVLTEIISTFAVFIGFSEDMFGGFASGDVAADIWDMDDALSSAGTSAKKLKQGLRGFDKLNVISTPTSGGSGGGGAGGLGIDPDILNAFNKEAEKYEKRLQSIKMKATEIRDKIMEVLGFTKEINPLTGEINWKYKGFKTTLKNIWNWFVKLNPKAKLLVGFIASLFTAKTISLATKFVKLIGSTGVFKFISNLLTPTKKLGLMFKDDLAGGMYGLNTAMGESINMWSKTLTLMDRIKVTAVGAGGMIASFLLIQDGMKDIAKEGANMNNILQTSAGVLGNIGSGALIGSQFGAYGAIIGGVTGAFVGLMEVLHNLPTQVNKTNIKIAESTEEINQYIESLNSRYETVNSLYDAELKHHQINEDLVEELSSLVDENGKVHEGQEKRVNFIITQLNAAYGLELELVEGIVQGYKEEKEEIGNVIEEKKKQIAIQKSEEKYSIALEEREETTKNLEEAEKNYTEALKNNAKATENKEIAMKGFMAQILQGKSPINAWAIAMSVANDELEESSIVAGNATTTFQEAEKAYEDNISSIIEYAGLLTAETEGNAQDIEFWTNIINGTFEDSQKENERSLSQMINDADYYYDQYIESAKTAGIEVDETVKKMARSQYDEVVKSLTDQKNYVDGYSDEYIDAWGTLATNSEEEFMNALDDLPQDIQDEIVSKMEEKGYSISEELQKGIDSADTPTASVDIDVDTTKASKNTQSWWDKFKKNFDSIKNSKIAGLISSFNITLPTLKFANGGLPPIGQLFVANEKGPELVGQIGGQSFVANQNQMMELLDKKISNTPSNNGINNATFVIQVGSKEVAREVLNELNNMAMANGSEILIGG